MELTPQSVSVLLRTHCRPRYVNWAFVPPASLRTLTSTRPAPGPVPMCTLEAPPVPSAEPATWVPCPLLSSGSVAPDSSGVDEVASYPANHFWSEYEVGSRSGSSFTSSKSFNERCSLSTPVSRTAMITPEPVYPQSWPVFE